MEWWERDFNSWLEETYAKDKSTSVVLSEEYVHSVLEYLVKGEYPEHMTPQQRSSFKFKGGNGTLIVLPREKFFSTLRAIHENSGHARSTTLCKKINAQYYGLPRAAVMKFLEGCIGCQCRAPQVNQAEPQQIVATEVFSRVQVDLIDMTMKESCGYRFIIHLMDHFSKFHMVAPLERKSSEEVNSALTKMFATIGLPDIVHTDNGAEFSRVKEIFRDWPGGSDGEIVRGNNQHVRGRPRHPQSQGLVERGHQLIQDKLAIAEAEWLATNNTPFPWHERLPFVQYQVNSNYSTVTNAAPYKLVFGREPRGPPVFGREGLVIESVEPAEQDPSFSTAYDLDDSYQEAGPTSPAAGTSHRPVVETYDQADPVATVTETSPRPADTNDQADPVPIVTETSPRPADTNDQVDPVPTATETSPRQVVTSDQADPVAPVTDANPRLLNTNDQADPVPTGTETSPRQVDTNDQYDRHTTIRQKARESTRKANLRRQQPKKRGKRVDQITVGSFVTIAIPYQDRHKSDNRRLPAVVVDKRGDTRATYKIRCEFGVLEGWFPADSIQLFKGQLPLSVEGWESCEVLPLRTAAARQRGSNTSVTRCKCRAGCKTQQCPCKKAGNDCNTSCHAGRSCFNRTTASSTTQRPRSEDSTSDPFSSSSMTVIQPVINRIISSGFSDDACEEALQWCHGGLRADHLRYLATKLLPSLPSFPMEKPCQYHADNLLQYGSGYMNFVPAQMRTSHAVYNVSDDLNRCLYNSISLQLYGDQKHSSFLKLAAVLTGYCKKEKIVEEVLQLASTREEVVAWAASFASEAITESLTGDAEYMVSRIVDEELFSSLSDNDSGPVQMMAMSHLLDKQVEVFCTQENCEPVQTYGEGAEKISLIRVPLNLHSVDGQIRFNHFVPAIRRTDAEEQAFVSTCGAADIGACSFSRGTQGAEWVECHDCGRWYHSLCLIDSTRGHTMKRIPLLKCGCLRDGPFKSSRTSILTNQTVVGNILREQRPFLKDLLANVVNRRFPSWRERFYCPNGRNNAELGRLSGLTVISENVATKMRQFIRQQLPAPTLSASMMDYVLFPELFIRLMVIFWGINKVEAEYIIQQYSTAHGC